MLCGECCRASAPTLYFEDLPLVERSILSTDCLYTLRAGEMVSSQRLESTFLLGEDLVKIRQIPDQGCVMLSGNLCRIHPDHPLQCRHLQCWSGRNASDLEDRERLERRQLYREDDIALQLIREYDLKLPADRLALLLEAISSGSASDESEALGLMDLDHRLRAGIESRYGYSQDEQLLLLGRPAVVVARAHGLTVVMRNGNPALAPLDFQS